MFYSNLTLMNLPPLTLRNLSACIVFSKSSLNSFFQPTQLYDYADRSNIQPYCTKLILNEINNRLSSKYLQCHLEVERQGQVLISQQQWVSLLIYFQFSQVYSCNQYYTLIQSNCYILGIRSKLYQIVKSRKYNSFTLETLPKRVFCLLAYSLFQLQKTIMIDCIGTLSWRTFLGSMVSFILAFVFLQQLRLFIFLFFLRQCLLIEIKSKHFILFLSQILKLLIPYWILFFFGKNRKHPSIRP